MLMHKNKYSKLSVHYFFCLFFQGGELKGHTHTGSTGIRLTTYFTLFPFHFLICIKDSQVKSSLGPVTAIWRVFQY